MRFPAFSIALALGVLAASPVSGQTSRLAEVQRCAVVPDTAVVPTPRQIEERRELRARLDSIGRANGVAAPSGLLLVDVDSTRQGKVFFLQSNLPPEVVATATRAVGEYLRSLPGGKAYQALIRIDGDYPALAPGRRHCRPALDSQQELHDMVSRVLDAHPQSGKLGRPVAKRAVVRLVVDREGKVAYVEVEQPTGDPAIDPHVQAIAERLRFIPARLDDMPFDSRFRFTLTFTLH